MEKKTLVLYDPDEEYVTRLMDFMCGSDRLPLEVHSFTDRDRLGGYVKENSVDVLLVAEGELDEELDCACRGEKIVLTEETVLQDGRGHRAVCKYQSSENIIREVMAYYADSGEKRLELNGRTDTQLIGVYSPVRRCGRTYFALALGEIFSHQESVLYVNLEEYSGFNSMLQRNFMMDMSDLLFYIGQKRLNFPCKLASMVEHLGEMDFIPPSIAPLDLGVVGPEGWVRLFNEIIACDYGKVIVDFGDGVEGLLDLLGLCSLIYTPVLEDPASRAKLEQYEAMLRIMERGDILKKTRRLVIPNVEDLNVPMEMLEHTGLGEYVKGVIRQGMPRAGGMGI